MTAKKVGILTVLVLALTVGGVLWLNLPRMDPWHCRPLVGSVRDIRDAVKGVAEGELREVYGDPIEDLQGWRHEWGMSARMFSEEYRTVIFRANRATLRVWFEKQHGEWVCGSSRWRPDRR